MKRIRLSIDDGCKLDMRVAELALKYDLECIFYIPVEWHSLAYDKGYEPLTYEDVLWLADNFEIGSHSITHRHLTRIPIEDAKREIQDSRDILEFITGKTITKFCPPRGYTNQELTDFTHLFYTKQRLTTGDNLVHIHPNSGANDEKHWIDCITTKTEELWGHSWEIDKYNMWKEFEDWLERTYS